MTPGPSVTGVRLVVPDHATGLPVLRALSLCTCCRHYPGAATGGPTLLIHPVVSAFPVMAAGSARASSFSRLARRSLSLRPAHSRCHQVVARLPEGFNHVVSSIVAPVLPAGAFRRVGLSPTGKRRLGTAHAMTGPRTAAPVLPLSGPGFGIYGLSVAICRSAARLRPPTHCRSLPGNHCPKQCPRQTV